jgi:hypothetical protein
VFKLRLSCHLPAKGRTFATVHRLSAPGPTPAPMSTLSTPPALLEAIQRSGETWQNDLHELFEQAKDRFPDILWERDEGDDSSKGPAEVWGHKGTSRTFPVFD